MVEMKSPHFAVDQNYPIVLVNDAEMFLLSFFFFIIHMYKAKYQLQSLVGSHYILFSEITLLS